MYNIPAKTHRAEELIKRSQFITSIAHASNADEANTFVAAIKKEFPDASHNCWAYVAGKPGDTAKIGMSDDGEPHGTAGKPMLNVLLHSDIGEIVAVVTRYFGGTKLGPGGLVKAYSGSVKNALEGISVFQKRQMTQWQISFAYPHINAIKLLIESYEGELLEEKYQENILMTVEVPEASSEDFIQTITDLCSGDINIAELR